MHPTTLGLTHAQGAPALAPSGVEVAEALAEIRKPVAVVASALGPVPVVVGDGGLAEIAGEELLALLPPVYPEWLGERSFTAAHGVRFPYVVGEMARGIATPQMAIAAVRAGGMGFYGSAGLDLDTVEAGVREIQNALGPDAPGWGANLIHNVQDDRREMATVELFLRMGVRCVSASAFMQLTPAVVLYAAKGLYRGGDGQIVRSGRIFAKVSRDEIARHFLLPAPEQMLRALVAEGRLTAAEAALAAEVPIAEDITAEADSGGHTDNRALTVLLPRLIALRDEISEQYGYSVLPRVGAAGGIGTPAAVAAAFAAGAAYVLTGSVNQSALESGLSEDGRNLLALAQATDVATAPAADMFEMGVTVQVLKRGTMFAQRGQRLTDFYRKYPSFDAAPADEVASLEKTVLRRSIPEIWAETKEFFATRDPREVVRAEADPHHLMALVFRWYLFSGAQWAREGDTDRRGDYQIWCGPAMGGFNDWVKGSFLEPVGARTTGQIALNLLEGAATVTRAGHLRTAGVQLPPGAFDFRPRPLG